MRKIILFVLALGLFSATPAHANTVFVPTSGWLVGPSTLVSDAEGGLPCVMMNQFSNGFVMRVSGGDQVVMGFALDVRQNAFTAGKSYDLGIAFDSGFRKVFKAEAYDTATIMAVTQDAPELYNALRDAREMIIGIEGKTLRFVMLGARDGLTRMEECFNPKGQPRRSPAAHEAAPMPEAPVRAGMKTADAPAPKQDGGVADAYRQLLMNGGAQQGEADIPLTAKSASQGQTMPPANTAARPQAPKVEKPAAPVADKPQAAAPASQETSRLDALFAQAEKSIRTQMPQTGETVAAAAPVAAPAGPKLQPAPAMPTRSFALPGAAQPQAAGQTEGQPLMANGLVPIAPRAPKPPRQMQVSAAETTVAPAAPVGAVQSWQALPGQQLREVLENWSNNAGARLVWHAQGDFKMPAGLAAQGTYESAVLSALKQFEGGAGARPAGQIYNDPQTGQKVLVVSQ